MGLVGVGMVLPRRAGATLSVAVSLAELVYDSQHVIVGTSTDAYCQWERVGNRSRIVTYSAVSVERPLDGRPPATSTVMVRTLCGVVGDKGQIVHGEAVVALHERAAIFLKPLAPELYHVTRMAQGYYPLAADEHGEVRLRATIEASDLIDVPDAAVRRLHGRSLPEAETDLARELARGAK